MKPLNVLQEAIHYSFIKLCIYSFSLWFEVFVHYALGVEKKIINMIFMRVLWNFSFFGWRDVSPTHSELCRFVSGSQAKHQVSSPVIILLKKIFVCVGHRDNFLARCDSIFPLPRCQGVWNKTCTQLSVSLIFSQNPKNYSLGGVQRFCYHSCCDSTVIFFFFTKSARAAMFISVRIDFGRPSLSSSSTISLPSRNREYHLKTFDRFRASFP